MSMHDALFGDAPIPDDTRRVARAAFPKGNLYLHLRDRFGMLYQNHQFAHLFAHAGQPALAPARLALVTVFQFLEGLSDRQAADHVRDRISWKYALGLPLDDPGFDFSVLSEFRMRLLRNDAEALLFDTVLDLCREAGLLKQRGKQRTDSTHVLAAMRTLHRLEHVGETVRHALNVLAVEAPAWLRGHTDPLWVARYGTRIEQYRLPKADDARQDLARQIGQDGYTLLEAVYAPDTVRALRDLPAVETLRQVWLQQYYRCTIPGALELRWRNTDDQPPSAQLILSPYDTEARYKAKHETSWIGYKVHLTETCDDETPNLITQVTTTLATTDDTVVLQDIQQALATKDCLPAEHYVDKGYTSAAGLVTSERDYGIDLVGPVQGDGHWQTRTPRAFTPAQFAIDWEAQQVVCPRGKPSQHWTPATTARDQAVIVVRFAAADCEACPVRAQCTRSKSGGRGLTLAPREQHIALQEARLRQETAAFKAQYARRAGIEGTWTQANRRSDLRQARYIGLAKTHLQHLLTAIAINVVRAMAWITGEPRATTRTSPFVKVMAPHVAVALV